jgi:ubiquinone/menaquinone biosynthesis C-methylase UbiE
MTLQQVTDRWKESAFLRKVYQRWYEDLIKSLQIKETDKVLEIGCGVGFFAEYLKKKFPKLDYTGIDYVPEAVSLAKKRVRNAKFIAADFQKATGKFDKVFCIDVVHHVNRRKFFRKVHSLLKKKGMFGAIEPNPGIISRLSCRLYGFHENVSKYPRPGQLKEEAEKQGFTVKTLSF